MTFAGVSAPAYFAGEEGEGQTSAGQEIWTAFLASSGDEPVAPEDVMGPWADATRVVHPFGVCKYRCCGSSERSKEKEVGELQVLTMVW